MGDRGEINVRDAMADLPRLLQRVKSGERLVITERGVPVAELVLAELESEHLIGSLRGRIRIVGDIDGTGVEWDAQRP